jgi:acyl carrier protein
MNKQQILEFLIAEAHKIRTAQLANVEVTASSRIMDDLGFDSLDYATLMLSCESWSGVRLSEKHIDWSQIQTVDALATLFAGL